MPYPVRTGVPQSARLKMTRSHSFDSYGTAPTSSPPEGVVGTHLFIGSEGRAGSYLSGLGEPEGEEVILNMMDFISHLRSREEGQALVEYALILSLIAVVCIGALTLLGGNVNNILNQIAGAL
jgi:pilus assembly protein Flp/PilA